MAVQEFFSAFSNGKWRGGERNKGIQKKKGRREGVAILSSSTLIIRGIPQYLPPPPIFGSLLDGRWGVRVGLLCIAYRMFFACFPPSSHSSVHELANWRVAGVTSRVCRNTQHKFPPPYMENTVWCTNCNLSPAATARWDHYWNQDHHHKLPNKVIRIRTRLFLSALLLQLLARGGGGGWGTSQIVHAEAGRQIETTHRWIHCQSLHLEKRNMFECAQLWIFFCRWRAFWCRRNKTLSAPLCVPKPTRWHYYTTHYIAIAHTRPFPTQ